MGFPLVCLSYGYKQQTKLSAMGAKCLFSIGLERGTGPAGVEKELVRRVMAHTGRRLGNWEVTCTAMTAADRKRPMLEIVSMSSALERRFVVSEGMVAEVGEGFPALLKKIPKYEQRSTRAIRGATFDFVDLVVSVGLSFDKGSPAGVVVEIEYRPCEYSEDCAELVEELMGKIAAPLVPPPQAGQDSSVNDVASTCYTYERVTADMAKLLPKEPRAFSHRHAAVLYVKLLS